MKAQRIGILGLLALALSALTALAFAMQEPAETALPDNPLDGRKLLESKMCIQCHGIAGQGLSIAPPLGGGRFRGPFLEMGAALWNHVPAMSASTALNRLPWPQLSSDEAAELMAFLYFIDYLGRPGDANAGRAVFEQKGCSSCHTIGGGRAKLGPDLAQLRRFASPLSVAQEIWNHGPTMFETMQQLNMSPPTFSQGDLADLSAFIRQEAGPGPRPPLLSAPGSPNRGRRLFAAKGCSQCHGRDARGGGGGPDLHQFDLHRSAEAIAGTMWNHALVMSGAMRSRGIGWPRFENSDLADLAAFLYFLSFSDPPGNPQRGSEVFVQRSCAECHSGKEDAAQAGPLLVEGDAAGSPATLVAAMWNHSPIMKKAILSQGRPWPELTGEDLRDLRAYLTRQNSKR